MVDPREIVMSGDELAFWKGVRRRGAFWYLVSKGLFFLAAWPVAGHFVVGWEWQPRLFLEAWVIGIVCGGFVWIRKELRYRFTLEQSGQMVHDGSDD